MTLRPIRVRLWMVVFAVALVLLLWKAPGLDFYLGSADHGYQLSVARQILLGKFPYVDVFFYYGPMFGLTSALGALATGNLVGETVICAVGYAAALTLLYVLVARNSFSGRLASSVAGSVAALAGLALLGRFYKWFFWLFPLLTLYFLYRFAQSPRRVWLLAAGCAAAVGGLYRMDLGVTLFIAAGMSLFAWSLKPFSLKAISKHTVFLLMGFAVPYALWLTVLTAKGGLWVVRDYVLVSFGNIGSVVQVWSAPIPSFDWSAPLSPSSRLAAAFMLVPVLYVLSGGLGLWQIVLRGSQESRHKFAIAVGAFGVGLLPQGIYRADVNHLLQVASPAMVAVMIVPACLKDVALRGGATRLPKSLALLVAAFSLAIGIGLPKGTAYDLVPLSAGVLARYRDLARGVRPSISLPVNNLALQASQMTSPEDTVLTVPLEIAPQLTYFLRRPVSGLLTAYAEGILDGPEWRRRNLDAVRRHPPSLVIASDRFFNRFAPSVFGKAPFATFQPELYDYLASNYTEVAFTEGKYVILVRPRGNQAALQPSM